MNWDLNMGGHHRRQHSSEEGSVNWKKLAKINHIFQTFQAIIKVFRLVDWTQNGVSCYKTH